MAGGTSVNQLKEQLETSQAENKVVQKQLEERMDKFQAQMESLSSRFEEQMAWLKHRFPENPEPGVMSVLKDPREKGLLPTPGNHTASPSSMIDLRGNRDYGNNQYEFFKAPKVDLPRFNGEDVKGWLQLCYLSFMFNSIPEEKKVMYVAMHFDGWARSWFLAEFNSIEGVSWGFFRDALVARFSNEGHENVVAELSQLRQTGTVVEFQARFEQLKSRVLEKWPDLHEGLLTDWFMGGLKKELRDSVQMQFPHCLSKAITLARLQESVFDQVLPRNNLTTKFYNNTYGDYSVNPHKSQSHTQIYSQLPTKSTTSPAYSPKPEALSAIPLNSKPMTGFVDTLRALLQFQRANEFQAKTEELKAWVLKEWIMLTDGVFGEAILKELKDEVNLRFFFPIVFDPGGIVGLEGSLHFNP